MLDNKFKHHSWFKGINMTNRQALEYMAANYGDFYIKQKPSKNQSDNLFDDINYDNCIADHRCSKRLSEDEKQYFLTRQEFWKQFRQKMNDLYIQWETENPKGDITEWYKIEHNEKMKVPEYKDYYEAYKKVS